MSLTKHKAVLVANADGFFLPALAALEAADVEIVEIWTDRADDFARSERRARRLIGRRVHADKEPGHVARRKGMAIRSIKRPFASGLSAALDACRFDFLLCVGSSIIFPEAFLDRLDRRAFNLHPALLPHYRGPLPMHAMLLHDTADKYGGMTLHVLEPGIDEGAIIGQRTVRLSDHPDHRVWFEAVKATMTPLVADDLMRHLRGELSATPQPPGEGSYHSAKQVPLVISSAMTVAEAGRFVRRGLMFVPSLRVAIPRNGDRVRKVRVFGEPLTLGPPTGAPPRLAPTRLDIDLRDARVRFARDHKIRRVGRKIGAMLSGG